MRTFLSKFLLSAMFLQSISAQAGCADFLSGIFGGWKRRANDTRLSAISHTSLAQDLIEEQLLNPAIKKVTFPGANLKEVIPELRVALRFIKHQLSLNQIPDYPDWSHRHWLEKLEKIYRRDDLPDEAKAVLYSWLRVMFPESYPLVRPELKRTDYFEFIGETGVLRSSLPDDDFGRANFVRNYFTSAGIEICRRVYEKLKNREDLDASEFNIFLENFMPVYPNELDALKYIGFNSYSDNFRLRNTRRRETWRTFTTYSTKRPNLESLQQIGYYVQLGRGVRPIYDGIRRDLIDSLRRGDSIDLGDHSAED